MIWGQKPDTFTDEDFDALVRPQQRGERPCYTAPQARIIYLNGFCLGALIGFASSTVFTFVVWQLTR